MVIAVGRQRSCGGAHACTHVRTFPDSIPRRLGFSFHEMRVDSQIGTPGTQPQDTWGRLGRGGKRPEKGRLCDPCRRRAPLAGGQPTWEAQCRPPPTFSISWGTQVPGSQRGNGCERRLRRQRELLVFCPDLGFVGAPRLMEGRWKRAEEGPPSRTACRHPAARRRKNEVFRLGTVVNVLEMY